jgi:hypothetical protein
MDTFQIVAEIAATVYHAFVTAELIAAEIALELAETPTDSIH